MRGLSARALVLSFDAADPGTVLELAAAGELPATAALLERAARVRTLAPEAVFVSANWPTLFTATEPDRHAYLCWDEVVPGGYDRRETGIDEVRGAPIWRRLSEAGRRVAVLDVPHTLIEPVNGVMLAEWACHDRHGETGSYPPELAGELGDRHGRPFGTAPSPGFAQFAPCDYTHRAADHRTPAETEALMEAFRHSIAVKGAASVQLLRRGGWDLFLSVMGESHCVGHQLWHLHDPAHEHHDPALVERLGGDPVRDVLTRLDGVLADHVAALGPEDTVYLTFAHGMTAHHDGTHLLDHVLERLDYALDHPDGFGTATRAAARVAALTPKALRGPLLRRGSALLGGRTGDGTPGPLPPREGRRFFQTPNNTVVGAVRLNLAGREPLGRVRREDRRAVLEWLAERLGELVNLATSGTVVTRCVIAEDAFRRHEGDGFADLYVEWDRSAPIERVWSPSVGTLHVPYEHWRQGDHVREGLTLAAGPGIAPGERPGVYRVCDLGATYAAAAGVALDDVDGRPIAGVLPDGAATGRPAAEPLPDPAARTRRSARRRSPRWAHEDAGVAAAGLLRDRLAASEQRVAELEAALDARVETLERLGDIAAMTAWLHEVDVPETLLVSVVLPTRNRAELLPEAVASVLAQSYGRFELLVVDDDSTDGTAAYLAGLDDPRVRVLRGEGRSAGAARNVALDEARGDVIAYLDDDNRFDRHWLRAVVSTFAFHTEATACYGARVVDDEGRVNRRPANGRRWIHYQAWDPALIRDHNLADMNVMAHRRSELRFDESMAVLADWDMLGRLGADEAPIEVPAIGAYYRSDSPGRLSDVTSEERLEAEVVRVRRRLRRETADHR